MHIKLQDESPLVGCELFPNLSGATLCLLASARIFQIAKRILNLL